MGMEWNQVWAFIVKEIAAFGVRWVFVGILILASGGFLGLRYRALKAKVEALERDFRSTTVIYNNAHIVNNPPDLGDVDEIRTMTQAEYDALPAKKEKTLYLIANRKPE